MSESVAIRKLSAAQRGRSIAVLLLLLGAGGALMSATQPWLTVAIIDDPLDVPGSQAVAVYQPIALVHLALALVLALVGRVLRYVFGAFAALGGTTLAVLSARVIAAPGAENVMSAVSEATGLTGDGIGAIAHDITVTGWPVAGLAFAIVMALAGLWTIVTAHRWQRGGKRYEQSRGKRDERESLDAIDSWDDFSRGSDPTHPSDHSTRPFDGTR